MKGIEVEVVGAGISTRATPAAAEYVRTGNQGISDEITARFSPESPLQGGGVVPKLLSDTDFALQW